MQHKVPATMSRWWFLHSSCQCCNNVIDGDTAYNFLLVLLLLLLLASFQIHRHCHRQRHHMQRFPSRPLQEMYQVRVPVIGSASWHWQGVVQCRFTFKDFQNCRSDTHNGELIHDKFDIDNHVIITILKFDTITRRIPGKLGNANIA